MLPQLSKRAFPQAWVDAGRDREQLAIVAKKRRALDSPRPDAILQRTWARATTTIADRPLHLFTPKSGSTGGVLFYCHGGAFVLGASALEWLHASRLATAMGLDLAFYDYPKVPEHEATEIRQATRRAYDVISDRYQSDRISIAGYSAGGNLAVSTMLQLHRDGRPMPASAALFSPWLDVTLSHPDTPDYADNELLLPISALRHDGMLYAGDTGAANPLVSPRFMRPTELAVMPPTMVTIGDQEILFPEANEYVDNLQSNGVHAQLFVEAGGQHTGVIAPTAAGSTVFKALVGELRTIVR